MRWPSWPTSPWRVPGEPSDDDSARGAALGPDRRDTGPEGRDREGGQAGHPDLVAVRQDFSGVFSGRALLIFPEASSLELVRVVVGRQLALEDIVDLEDEALAETGNIILNSWVATIANLLKKNLKMSLPVIRRDQSQHLRKCQPAGIPHPVSSHQVRYQPAANPGLCRLDDGRSVGRRAPIADCRLRGQSRRPRRLNSGADGTKAAPLPSSHR